MLTELDNEPHPLPLNLSLSLLSHLLPQIYFTLKKESVVHLRR